MTCPSAADTVLELDFVGVQFRCRRVKMKIGLQFRYYRVPSKALLGFTVPDNQASMTAHYNPYPNRDLASPISSNIASISHHPAFK